MFQDFTAIVLAAGLSRRTAPRNKLLLSIHGKLVVRSTVEAVCHAGFGEVLVVTGHEHERVEEALAGVSVRFVHAGDYAMGMGHSLAAGVRNAASNTAAFVITPGDLPGLTPRLVRTIAEQFLIEGGGHHIIPMANGGRGHPVIIGSWIRRELESLTGDEGARKLLSGVPEVSRCRFVEVGDVAILLDVDFTDDGDAEE